MEVSEIRELSDDEVDKVSGGKMDFSTAGLAIIALGFAGGPATAAFGLPIGGALIFLDNFA